MDSVDVPGSDEVSWYTLGYTLGHINVVIHPYDLFGNLGMVPKKLTHHHLQ